MCFQRFLPVILIYQHQLAQSKRGEDTPGKIMMPWEEDSVWTPWFQVAQCSPSPLGIFLPGPTGLLQLSTTFTPSTARMYLINCYVFPSTSIKLCFASSTEEKSYHENITETRHLWSKCRESLNFYNTSYFVTS